MIRARADVECADARAAVLLARIHDAAAELLALARPAGPLPRLRVPLEQVQGAAMRAAGKLEDPHPTPRA